MKVSRRYLIYALALLLTGSILVTIALSSHITRAQNEPLCFPETGQCIYDPIRTYWEEHGGLPVFGFPITAPRTETIGDWTGTAQWFERDRLEDHGPHGVMSGNLGAYLLQLEERSWYTFPQAQSAPEGCMYFDITQHSLCEPFLSYWEEHGGLERFGYPITEPFLETIDHNWTIEVQYFQRRRMELHPELPEQPVLLGRLGSEVLEHVTEVQQQQACVEQVLPALREAYEQVSFREQFGCPTGTPSTDVRATTQHMEHGLMLWIDRGYRGGESIEGRHIFVITTPGMSFKHYIDRWNRYDDPYTLDIDAPSGRYAPRGGFGKVWLEDPTLRQNLGWALEREEQERRVSVQDFAGGTMVRMHDTGIVYAFGDPDTPSEVQIIK